MKNLFFFLLWIATASYSFAQTATNQPILDLFENVDMIQIPTGILKERGFPVFDMDFYNGQTLTDNNRVDANNFGWMYPLASYLPPRYKKAHAQIGLQTDLYYAPNFIVSERKQDNIRSLLKQKALIPLSTNLKKPPFEVSIILKTNYLS